VKGDQIIHVFICEALAVLFMSLMGGLEAVWAQMRQGFHTPVKAPWPSVSGRCWPSCGRAELPAPSTAAGRLPVEQAEGPLCPRCTKFSLSGGKCNSDLGLTVVLGVGEPHPSLPASPESLFREVPSTYGVVPFPECLSRYMIPWTCDFKMFQGILNCFAFYSPCQVLSTP